MKRTLVRRMVYICLITVIIFTSIFYSYSAKYRPNYEREAKILYDIGLYKGINNSVFVPDLGTLVDRQTAIGMLLRIFGCEKEALNLSESDADAIISRFSDKDSVSGWAKKQVAYAINENIVIGYPDGSLKPKDYVTVKMYCTMILKELGYDFHYNESAKLFSEIVEASYLSSIEGSMNKDLLAGISYYTLGAKYKEDTRRVIDKLVDDGVVDRRYLDDRQYGF